MCPFIDTNAGIHDAHRTIDFEKHGGRRLSQAAQSQKTLKEHGAMIFRPLLLRPSALAKPAYFCVRRSAVKAQEYMMVVWIPAFTLNDERMHECRFQDGH